MVVRCNYDELRRLNLWSNHNDLSRKIFLGRVVTSMTSKDVMNNSWVEIFSKLSIDLLQMKSIF